MKEFTYTNKEGDEITVGLETRKAVCPRCMGGELKIDCFEGGLTASEIHEEGPEFFEDYCNGVYSVQCPECKGANVVDEVDTDCLTDEEADAYFDWLNEEAGFRAEVESERRMGA